MFRLRLAPVWLRGSGMIVFTKKSASVVKDAVVYWLHLFICVCSFVW